MSNKISKNVSENAVVNNEMEQFINENIGIVPKMMMKRFMNLSMDEQVKKIQFYIDRKKWIEEQKERNRIVNLVKEMFEKRQATVEDARDVLRYCTDFIDSFKQREIEKLDDEIRKLQEMKRSLED